MLTVEDWAEIRRLHLAEGLGKQTIAKRLGIARNTVKAALANPDPPVYRRRRRPSAVDPYEDQIRALLKGCNTMPATVIAERIGWTRGMTILKERVAEIRPLFLEPDPFQRTDYRPGELAQWDIWLPAVDIPVGYGHTARLPVIVGVAGYSRVIVGRMIPSREAPDVLLGHFASVVDLVCLLWSDGRRSVSPMILRLRDGHIPVPPGLWITGISTAFREKGSTTTRRRSAERNATSRARTRRMSLGTDGTDMDSLGNVVEILTN